MDVVLEMKNVTKKFGNFKAISNIDLTVRKNDIHAICGENGAGKSTLMKVLSGVYDNKSFEGEIIFNKEKCEFSSIRDSEEKGIVIIHQELMLIPELSVMENIFLGNEEKKYGKIDWAKQKEMTYYFLRMVGIENEVSADDLVEDLGVGQQQLIEIAKALNKDAKLLILDEPTAALNEIESQNLLKLLKNLQANGMTAIMISHKLNEIIEVCNACTVIRDGEKIIDYDTKEKEIEEKEIVKNMVGRDMSDIYPKKEHKVSNEKILEVENLTVLNPDNGRERIKNVTFNLKEGEVLGIAGLMGAGRTEIALSIFGQMYGKVTSGVVKKEGKEIEYTNINKALEAKIAYVSEDRKKNGLVLENPLYENMSLATLDKISKNKIIDKIKELEQAEEYKKILKMRVDSVSQAADSLSGGNQQKVVLAKWLLTDPDILILDEPTRGIDVGAKQEIYQIINDLAKQGKSIILISSELPELIGLSDRVYVLNEGKIIGELENKEITPENIMSKIVSDKKE
ncbi:MAG: ATP-binding cassette domain-containing protein [Mycoplasmatales bacterium]